MALAINADRPASEGYVPLLMGDSVSSSTEIWNPESREWQAYRSMPDIYWRASDCMSQLPDGTVYNVRTDVLAIDPSNPQGEFVFEPDTLGDPVPDPLIYPSRCSGAEIDGTLGRKLDYIFVTK